MKNKKAHAHSGLFLMLLILVSITAIIIVTSFVVPFIKNQLRPDFKITIEECRNETIYNETLRDERNSNCDKYFDFTHREKEYYQHLCEDIYDYNYDFNIEICNEQKEEEEKLFISCFNSEIIFEEKKIEEEICEQVEVDEIILDEATAKDYGFKCSQDFSDEIIIKNGDCSEDRVIARLIMSKQDITTSWLNENCECLELKNCSWIGRAKDEGDSCCNSMGCKLKDCSKYKCGEYQVEVIR